MTSIDNLINQAKQQAQEVQQNVSGGGAVATQTAGTNVVAHGMGTPFSMDDLVGRGVAVNQWISVKEYGIQIKKDVPKFFDHLEVVLDMEEVVPCMAIKNSQSQYKKTYDGVTATTGESWPQIVASYARANPKDTPYPSADIPLLVPSDIKDGDTVLAAEGSYIGVSLSTTNWRNWVRFYNGLCREGLQKSVLKIKLGFEKRSNGKNDWGVFTFETLEVVEDRREQAAA